MSGMSLLTLRVSRDGGKTWGERRVWDSTSKLPPLLTSQWPECKCARCAARGVTR